MTVTGPITTSFGGGRQESDSKTGTQDGGRGARGTILNKGWSCDDTSSAARCAIWLGGTRRVGEQGRPLPCFPREESAVLSRKVTRGHKRVARVGSTYHEERRTCCDNDAQSEPSTRPSRVAVGGGPRNLSPFFSLNRQSAPTCFGSRGTNGPTGLSVQGKLD